MPYTASNGEKKIGNTMPTNEKEWKFFKEERKARRRKWKEQKLIAALEKQKEIEENVKRRKLEETEQTQKFTEGRQYTLSIAIPGSILDNAQTPELRTYLAGQIARAAVVFNVDEIVIFDETESESKTTEGLYEGVGKKGNCNVQMARILQYLECPQYLRKSFFPQHKDLKYAGLLNPLDTTHHVKANEKSPYREGVVLDKPVKPGKGSFVNVGLLQDVQIDKHLRPGLRVTVRMPHKSGGKHMKGVVVGPSVPRTEDNLYWGYSVRMAGSLGKVFTECLYKGGYDVLIGTSERGDDVTHLTIAKDFKHALVVFGGLQGLEASLDSDQDLQLDDPRLLFHHYINTCPNQGSRTIRTEEAILISLSAIRPAISKAHCKKTKSDESS